MTCGEAKLYVVVTAGGVEMTEPTRDHARAKADLIQLRGDHPNEFFHLEERDEKELQQMSYREDIICKRCGHAQMLDEIVKLFFKHRNIETLRESLEPLMKEAKKLGFGKDSAE